MENTVVRYTWGEYLASLPDAKEKSWSSGGIWTDNETFDSALAKMANGDDTYAEMANKLMDRLTDLSEGVPVREWTPNVMGAYAVIPEVITGMPLCMRSFSHSGESQPLKVIVSTTCSGGIDCETMTKRGVAILALVQKLRMVRPVELIILVEGNVKGRGNLFQLITVDLPLSVAHACFAMANAGFARVLTYAHMHKYFHWNGGWSEGFRSSGYDKNVREACGFADEDLWISAAYLHDSELINNPLAWVNKQLAKYSGALSE